MENIIKIIAMVVNRSHAQVACRLTIAVTYRATFIPGDAKILPASERNHARAGTRA
jgi:hypothetical protein